MKTKIKLLSATTMLQIINGILARDKQLHYSILVDDVLMKCHVDEIYPAGDFLTENQGYIPGWHYLSRNADMDKDSSPLATMADQSSSSFTQELSSEGSVDTILSTPFFPGQSMSITLFIHPGSSDCTQHHFVDLPESVEYQMN